MRYIFFGTPEFAAIVLEKLISGGIAPLAAVTNPDRPVGRKQVVTPPPVKLLALEHGLSVLQPEHLDVAFVAALRPQAPDFFVVAAYAKILSEDVLAIPRLGTVGVHPSLLPKYRGATPIQSVLLAGESETGVTLFLMDKKVDHGPIIAMQKLKIGNQNYPILQRELAELAGGLLVETLPKFMRGEITPSTQDDSSATYTKKFATEDGFVEWKALKAAERGEGDADMILRKIRSLNPNPGVWTIRDDGKRVKLLHADIDGRILRLKNIQVEGGVPRSVN